MAPFLTDLPLALVVLLVCVFCAALSLAGLVIVRRFIPHPILQEHNDVAGFIYGSIGVIYAVFLAFTVAAVWEDYETVSDRVNAEAAGMQNLHRELHAFQGENGEATRAALRGYVESVLEDEWPLLAEGNGSEETEFELENLWRTVGANNPQSPSQEAWLDATISSLERVTDLRATRVAKAQENLPSILLVFLVVGGVISISYTYLYGVRNIYGQIAMTIALSTTIAIAWSMILLLDSPFRGDVSISAAPIRDAFEMMQR